MPKLEAIENEIIRIKNLRTNLSGPVADSYDTLQGIVFINEIQKIYLTVDNSPDLYRTLVFCSDLISYNIVKLLKRMQKQLCVSGFGAPSSLCGAAVWIKYLLSLAEEIDDALVLTERGSRKESGANNSLVEELTNEYAIFCAEAESKYPMALLVEAIGSAYLDDALAVFSHTIKIVSITIRHHIQVRAGADENFDDFYYGYIRQCVDSMSTHIDTYIDQFRLLHQIPEALSIVANRKITNVISCLESSCLSEATSMLNSVNPLLDIILSCLVPLVEIMYPSEYHKMRENLGGTSGSHSDLLGTKLLRNSYVALCSTYLTQKDGHKNSGKEEEFSDFERALLAFRHRIFRWRDRHLLLPRDLLGLETTSLTGSRNAPDVVRRMAENYEHSDPLAERLKVGQQVAELPPLHAAEKQLLAITGEITRTKFDDVEKRRGLFLRKVE